MEEYETRNVVLDAESIRIIDQVVEDKKLGQRGFSAALRAIIHEWSTAVQELEPILADESAE